MSGTELDPITRLVLRLYVEDRVAFARGKSIAVLTIRKVERGGAEVEYGGRRLRLIVRRARQVNFNGTRVGLFILRANNRDVRISIDAPGSVKITRPGYHEKGAA